MNVFRIVTRTLAVEWGPQGIRGNAIAPGPIGDTEGTRRLFPGEAAEKLRKVIPARRFWCCAVSGLAPKGPQQTSPGQRPGLVDVYKNARALKGRDIPSIVPPLQGSIFI